jgi:hypothetical protein
MDITVSEMFFKQGRSRFLPKVGKFPPDHTINDPDRCHNFEPPLWAVPFTYSPRTVRYTGLLCLVSYSLSAGRKSNLAEVTAATRT